MFNLLFKASVAGLAVIGAKTAWRFASRGASEPSARVCAAPAFTTSTAPSSAPWPAARLARIDHDLRTPIGTIANTVELLRSMAPESDVSHEAFEVIERQVRRLTTLTAELHEVVALQDASDVAARQTDRSGH